MSTAPVSFASGSDFLINASSTSYSSLAVSGSASLGGTLSVASTNGTYPVGEKMTVLTAARRGQRQLHRRARFPTAPAARNSPPLFPRTPTTSI